MPGGGGGGSGGAQAVGAVALGGALLGLAAYGIAQLDERKRQNAPDVHMSPVTMAEDDAASGQADGASGRLLVLWDMYVAPRWLAPRRYDATPLPARLRLHGCAACGAIC